MKLQILKKGKIIKTFKKIQNKGIFKKSLRYLSRRDEAWLILGRKTKYVFYPKKECKYHKKNKIFFDVETYLNSKIKRAIEEYNILEKQVELKLDIIRVKKGRIKVPVSILEDTVFYRERLDKKISVRKYKRKIYSYKGKSSYAQSEVFLNLGLNEYYNMFKYRNVKIAVKVTPIKLQEKIRDKLTKKMRAPRVAWEKPIEKRTGNLFRDISKDIEFFGRTKAGKLRLDVNVVNWIYYKAMKAELEKHHLAFTFSPKAYRYYTTYNKRGKKVKRKKAWEIERYFQAKEFKIDVIVDYLERKVKN